MTQYILLIQGNTTSEATAGEWEEFFSAAQNSGLFRGGSAIGQRDIIGDARTAISTEHVVGFMRFDSPHKQAVLDLLKQHPIIMHGGSAELCEMPKS